MFSFNSPYGACPTCAGLGSQLRADPSLLIKNPELSILQGGSKHPAGPTSKGDSIAKMYYDALAKKYHFKLTTPIKDLPKEVMDVIMYRTGGAAGAAIRDGPRGTGRSGSPLRPCEQPRAPLPPEHRSQRMREEYEEYLGEYLPGLRRQKAQKGSPRGHCGRDVHNRLLRHAGDAGAGVHGGPARVARRRDRMIADRILKEIRSRLSFLASVGLQYLTLPRGSRALSGGESQRIRLQRR